MQSLYFKIFLWFWLAMVLVSGTLIFSVVTTQTEFTANRAEELDKILTSLVAARAADMLQDHSSTTKLTKSSLSPRLRKPTSLPRPLCKPMTPGF
jgi:uncharacterized membrane protein affecting hemolysin expression